MVTATNDGVDSEPFEVLPAGTTLGAYRITRPIGSGGMAVVYAAQHQTLGKQVAIKVLQGDHAKRTAVARRFMREGEAAARLSHPNVVEVFDVGAQENVGPYLVMEFLDGEDLGRYLGRRGRLSVLEVADLMIPVLSGVVAAHGAGIVHRDLKPDNIFLCSKRGRIVPKVVDFGVSKLDQLVPPLATALTQSRVLLGTPSYMSPEQARGQRDIDGRTDQFSLGVILYECTTGSRPFASDSLYGILTAIVEKTPERPSKLAHMPEKFERLIMRALSKHPEERFASTAELGRALLHFASASTNANYASDFEERERKGGDPRAVTRPLLDSAPGPGQTTRRRLPRTAIVGALGVFTVAAAMLVHQTGAPRVRDASALSSRAQGRASTPSTSSAEPAATPRAQAAPPATISRPVAPAMTYSVHVVVEPPQAQISLDGKAVAVGTFSADIVSDGLPHVLAAGAPGYDDWSLRFQGELPTQRVVLKRSALLGQRAQQPPPRGRPAASTPAQRKALPASPSPVPESPAVSAPAAGQKLIPGGQVAPGKGLSIDTSDPYAN